MSTPDQLNDALIDQAAKTLAALDPCHDTVVLLGRVVMERDRLKAENERLRKMSTIEMCCENLNVKHHTEEWEQRCLKAEEKLDRFNAAKASWDRLYAKHMANDCSEPCDWCAVDTAFEIAVVTQQ